MAATFASYRTGLGEGLISARLSFVKELPHEHAGTTAGGAEPANLDRAIATASQLVIAVRAREVRF